MRAQHSREKARKQFPRVMSANTNDATPPSLSNRFANVSKKMNEK
jgi:hypothetical protein